MQTEKLMEALETRFGVPREFATPLLPMLERVASGEPSSAEWNVVLAGIARAYRASQGEVDKGAEVNEVSGLMNQFAGELKKLDESLKVLSVYLDRVNQHMHPSLGSRFLH
ncbi:MAG: hypothetical protein JRG76_05870 [Deltaproteobacteria bacterium]|nr:hypothetical protein [Deltaproteobacteria bacterium]MBW2414021.1 hypothetical protein [Deltaproteobacteria bacterium]